MNLWVWVKAVVGKHDAEESEKQQMDRVFWWPTTSEETMCLWRGENMLLQCQLKNKQKWSYSKMCDWSPTVLNSSWRLFHNWLFILFVQVQQAALKSRMGHMGPPSRSLPTPGLIAVPRRWQLYYCTVLLFFVCFSRSLKVRNLPLLGEIDEKCQKVQFAIGNKTIR